MDKVERENDGGGHHGAPSKPYKIRIDKSNFEIANPTPTGRELLLLAGKTPPEQFQLFQRMPGGALEEIGLDRPVDLREPGVERFVTLPLDQTEGEATMVGTDQASGPAVRRQLRRHFRLPENDEIFLEGLGLDWETVIEAGVRRLVIYDYPVPPGYTEPKVTINLRIEPAYPDTQIDMVYVLPPLARQDRRPIPNLSNDKFDGKTWQRWSRHRTKENPWRPGVDDVSTHLAAVDHWFARELTKAA